MPASLAARMLATVRRHHMLRPGARVAAAVSGGGDSVALLRLLLDLAGPLGLALSVAHFDHRLRPDSAADAAFVAALAGRFGLPLHAGAAAGGPEGGNLEQAARRNRYRFLRGLVKSGAVDQVATGHTLDDQAETVLLRILRGAGPTGLAGIWPCLPPAAAAAPARRPWLIRPLLDLRREELRAHLAQRDQTWREDPSNRQLDRTRNRLRHETLPQLARECNPALMQRLATLAEVARAEEEHWRRRTRNYAARIWRRSGEGGAMEWSAEGSALRRLPLALRRRVLREGIRIARGSLRRIDFASVERIVICLGEDPAWFAGDAHPRERRLPLPGLECRVNRARLVLRRVKT